MNSQLILAFGYFSLFDFVYLCLSPQKIDIILAAKLVLLLNQVTASIIH